MLVVALACVAFTVVESTAVLRLFGGEWDAPARKQACGPQVDIETPACQVVETRSKYELRKYTDTEVSTLHPNLEPVELYRILIDSCF
jgi:hypothetical protein